MSVTWNGVKMCSQRGQAAKTGNADLVSLDLKIARRTPETIEEDAEQAEHVKLT